MEKRDGVFETWDENGKPVFRINYKNDLRDGITEEWHENGHLRLHEIYKDGIRV